MVASLKCILLSHHFQLQLKQLALAKQAAESRIVQEIQQTVTEKDSEKQGSVLQNIFY